MFDSYLIREDSLENTVEDGKVTLVQICSTYCRLPRLFFSHFTMDTILNVMALCIQENYKNLRLTEKSQEISRN